MYYQALPSEGMQSSEGGARPERRGSGGKKKQVRRDSPLRVSKETIVEIHDLRDLLREEGLSVLPADLRAVFNEGGYTLAAVVRAGVAALRAHVDRIRGKRRGA